MLLEKQKPEPHPHPPIQAEPPAPHLQLPHPVQTLPAASGCQFLPHLFNVTLAFLDLHHFQSFHWRPRETRGLPWIRREALERLVRWGPPAYVPGRKADSVQGLPLLPWPLMFRPLPPPSSNILGPFRGQGWAVAFICGLLWDGGPSSLLLES